MNLTVNHSIQFVNQTTRAHTNTMRARGVQWRLSLGSTTLGRIMNFIWHTTCSRRGARRRACHLSWNSCISSPT
jgi:hypothetical protein